jgi:hypothetical protein
MVRSSENARTEATRHRQPPPGAGRIG